MRRGRGREKKRKKKGRGGRENEKEGEEEEEEGERGDGDGWRRMGGERKKEFKQELHIHFNFLLLPKQTTVFTERLSNVR